MEKQLHEWHTEDHGVRDRDKGGVKGSKGGCCTEGGLGEGVKCGCTPNASWWAVVSKERLQGVVISPQANLALSYL